jgi:hypothetical protein
MICATEKSWECVNDTLLDLDESEVDPVADWKGIEDLMEINGES